MTLLCTVRGYELEVHSLRGEARIQRSEALLRKIREESPNILSGSRRSFESVYHALLFAYNPTVFKSEAMVEEAAYEYDRRLLEEDEYLKYWLQGFNCRNNVSAPILHKQQSSLKFRILPSLNATSGPDGARSYVGHCERYVWCAHLAH